MFCNNSYHNSRKFWLSSALKRLSISSLTSLSSSSSSITTSPSSSVGSPFNVNASYSDMHQLKVKTPPRTTSLKFRQILLNATPTSPLSSMFPEATPPTYRQVDEDDFEEIDLHMTEITTAEDVAISEDDCGSSMTSSSSSSSSNNSRSGQVGEDEASLTHHPAKHVDALLSTASLQKRFISSTSSLAEGSASILLDGDKRKEQHSRIAVFDDGKEELLQHGIPVKEIPSHLEPMVLPSVAPTQTPHYQRNLKHGCNIPILSLESTAIATQSTAIVMSDMYLQKPEFACIYY